MKIKRFVIAVEDPYKAIFTAVRRTPEEVIEALETCSNELKMEISSLECIKMSVPSLLQHQSITFRFTETSMVGKICMTDIEVTEIQETEKYLEQMEAILTKYSEQNGSDEIHPRHEADLRLLIRKMTDTLGFEPIDSRK